MSFPFPSSDLRREKRGALTRVWIAIPGRYPSGHNLHRDHRRPIQRLSRQDGEPEPGGTLWGCFRDADCGWGGEYYF
jgi:hypothetical protein